MCSDKGAVLPPPAVNCMNSDNYTLRKILLLLSVAIAVAVAVMFIYGLPAKKCEGPNPECRYELASLKKTDPALLLQAGVAIINPSISNLTALAVDSADNIYIGSSCGIEILDAKGVRVGGFAVDATVRCLTVSLDGEILVGLNSHVEVYEKNGTRKAVWKSPDSRAGLTSIASSSNSVFVADYVNRIVWRYSRSGELLGRIGDKDDGQRKSGFVVPSAFFDVAVARDGSLWVVSPGQHRLEHFSAEGDFIKFWGEFGIDGPRFCGCCNPSNFAIMPDGSFVTSEKHIVRVKVYDADGRFKGIVSGQEDWQKEAVGLDMAVDSKGRILVLDPQSNVVRLYLEK